MTTGKPAHEPVTFVAWTSRSGRAEDIAHALDGRPAVLSPSVPKRLPAVSAALLRYALSLLAMLRVLLRQRPRVVVATNPPIIPVIVAAVYARATGGRFVMDSHPTAFGAKGHRVSQRLQPLHRWLARRAAAVLVTIDERAEQVDSWGGRGLLVHEPPVAFPHGEPADQPTVLFVGTFASDEPVREVVEAARLLPEVHVQVTGDPARCPLDLRSDAPPNVDFVGYLDPRAYRHAVASAHVVLTLTTEPSSVMRSAYEAVYAGTPLVVSDTPALREFFPEALHSPNTAAGIAGTVSAALGDLDRLRAGAQAARAVQTARWQQQLAELREACGLPKTSDDEVGTPHG